MKKFRRRGNYWTIASGLSGLFALFISTTDSWSQQMNLGAGQSGLRADFSSKGCGENGVRDDARAIQVVVVGESGGLRCIISITDALLSASNIAAGYACVSSETAKPAMFVRQDDPRVVRERGYAQTLARGLELAKVRKKKLEVILIVTSSGPPHQEPRCGKLRS